MFDFSNRVVFITGAAGALGRVVAQSFEKAGANLALLDLQAGDLQKIFPHLANSVDHILCESTDLADAKAVATTAAAVANHFNRIDVLVNVAGGFRMGPPLHETPVEIWDLMLDMNARSVFNMSQAVIPSMLKQGGGKIVSVAARAALSGKAKMAAYTASKSVVIRLTESMAAELKDSNINVNCILPGTIDTPTNRRDMPTADYSRWVPPQDLAEVILFLASDAARAIHGAAVPVYGLT